MFNDPIGGRSVIEVSSEFRMRVTEQIGVVPFVDGGTVYQEAYPDFSNTFRWAAGLGLRYFTGFGPVRLDVAFPIHKRDSDDTYQFYISFGQAF
jgi:translocation and assembly module TamA